MHTPYRESLRSLGTIRDGITQWMHHQQWLMMETPIQRNTLGGRESNTHRATFKGPLYRERETVPSTQSCVLCPSTKDALDSWALAHVYNRQAPPYTRS